MFASALAFAGVAALINVTPGLDTLLVLRTSVTQGRRTGLAAALGILTGCLAWGLATAAGLTTLLTASHLAYDAVRVAGAAYLALLGASALWQARRGAQTSVAQGAAGELTGQGAEGGAGDGIGHGPGESTAQTPSPAPAPTPVEGGRLAAFRSGVGTNLLNPKAGVFYMSLIPQFTPHGAAVFSTTLLLTAIDVVELTLWYWVVSGAASALSERLARPSFRRRMEQVSGVAFFGFAANLLVTER